MKNYNQEDITARKSKKLAPKQRHNAELTHHHYETQVTSNTGTCIMHNVQLQL